MKHNLSTVGKTTYLPAVCGTVNAVDLDITMSNPRYNLNTLEITGQDHDVTPSCISLQREVHHQFLKLEQQNEEKFILNLSCSCSFPWEIFLG